MLHGSLCTASPDCVKILDANGCVKFFNEEGLRLMEIDSLDDVLDLYWPSLWPQPMQPFLAEALERTRRTGTANFEAQCPTAKGVMRWWDVTIATLPGDDAHFVVVSRDVTDARTDRMRESDRHDRLDSIMRSNTDALWDIDLLNGQVWWGEGMIATFGHQSDQIGATPQWRHDHIHPEDRARVIDSTGQAIADGSTTWEAEFRFLAADGTYRYVLDRGAITYDLEGRAIRFVGIMQDITARSAIADAQKIVAGELAHRINNILAVVSGLFQNSVRSTTDRDSLVEAFGGRVMAMAAANTAVLRSALNGARLDDLIAVQLAPFIGSGRLSAVGPSVLLPEATSQPFALAINELATNALKYGALANNEGRVELRWQVRTSEGQERLVVDWRETGGPLVSPPSRQGLGSKLIDRGIRGAEVIRRFDPAGFSCTLDLPLQA